MSTRRGNAKTIILVVVLLAAGGGAVAVWTNGFESFRADKQALGSDGKPLLSRKTPREGGVVISDQLTLYIDPVRGGAIYTNGMLAFPLDMTNGFTDHQRTDRYIVFRYPIDSGSPSTGKWYGLLDIKSCQVYWEMSKSEAASKLRKDYAAGLPDSMK
jgi:hypothetical protein